MKTSEIFELRFYLSKKKLELARQENHLWNFFRRVGSFSTAKSLENFLRKHYKSFKFTCLPFILTVTAITKKFLKADKEKYVEIIKTAMLQIRNANNDHFQVNVQN